MLAPNARIAFIASALSGLFMACAFPPIGAWPFAIVALLPLLWVWSSASIWRAAWSGFVFGVLFFGVVLSWAWYFGAVAILPLVATQALYVAAVGSGIAAIRRLGTSSPLIVAAAWSLGEYLRGTWPLGGLAWGEVGTAMSPFTPARGLAAWAGALGVTFAVVLSQAVLLEVLLKATRRGAAVAGGEGRGAHALHSHRLQSHRIHLGVAALLVLIFLAAGLNPPTTREVGALKIAAIQGNDLNRMLSSDEISNQVLTEKHFDLAGQLTGDYDLIIFPESALMSDPEADPLLMSRIVATARRHNSFVLINAINREQEGAIYNTNRLYAPDGSLVANYSKRHLVPFGEYVPWRSELSFISAIDQVPEDFTAGQNNASNSGVLNLDRKKIGSLICFESVFPELARREVRDGAEALIVSTNNRSYRRSANSAQHVQSSQMRAAETGRALVQASISGISAIIDPRGHIEKRTELFKPAIIETKVPLRAGETPYVKHGPLIVEISATILIAAVAFGLLRRRLQSMPSRGDSSE
ncbi:apolipoprotein N-acyltransferase [Actinobacteria bacterium IMCC26256]|nr:apolipoprotein N-acyltransferase [Actinobacteria bacterium IMCC26256]